MNIKNHNNNAISICEYTLGFIIFRQKELGKKNMSEDRLALIDEYREWITNGISEDNALYLINKR